MYVDIWVIERKGRYRIERGLACYLFFSTQENSTENLFSLNVTSLEIEFSEQEWDKEYRS